MTFSMLVMMAVTAAAVAFAVLMIVVITLDVGIVGKSSFCKSFYRLVSASARTAVQPDSCFSESILSAHADATADKSINILILQKSGKRAVTASVCINNLLFCDLSIFYIVNFKLLGMTEMLKYLTIFISNCNSHLILSFSF